MMPDAFDHCEALVREVDKDRFLATLFAPAKYRRPLFALYAFNVEVARVREQAREPMPGEIRLQWWRDVFAGSGRGEVRANPVAAALLDTVVRYRLPPKMLADLIDARTFDLYDDAMASLADLDGYAARTIVGADRSWRRASSTTATIRLSGDLAGMPASPSALRGCCVRFRCTPRGINSICRRTFCSGMPQALTTSLPAR